jgi:hypothetical protein
MKSQTMRFATAPAWFTAASMVACSQGGPANDHAAAQGRPRYATILEAPPRTPIPRLGPEPYTRTVEDRRFFYADAIEQKNLPLLRRIKSEHMGNFGGVEWRWRDGPETGGLGRLTGLVYFLSAPEATLSRYTRDPLFRAAKGDFSRTDQDRVARTWAARIGTGIAPADFGQVASPEFGNMRVPRLRIAMPRREFEARAKAEGWRLPANLILRFDPMADPDLPAVDAVVAPLIRAFPQEARLGGPTPDIATFDAVVLRDGCFFIDAEGPDDPLVEFPFSIGVFRDAEGYLSFRSRYSQQPRVLGRVGTRLQLGYRTERTAPAALQAACRAKKIVTVSSADQAAGYGSRWFDVKQYRDRHRLTSAEAMRRANACMTEQERILAKIRLGRKEERLVSCMEFIDIPPPPPPPPPPEDRGSLK